MARFQIWSTGYLCTGMEGIPSPARFHGEWEGENLLDACSKCFAGNDDYEVEDSVPSLWGCNIFDNEADARKLFG